MDLPVLEYSTVTSAYCNNVDLAFDYDPTTYATFFTPIGPVTPESPPATVKVPVPATLQSIAPATALIAAYQFNEGSGNTSQDAANGQSATLQVTGGTATMSWVTGEAGNALLLALGLLRLPLLTYRLLNSVNTASLRAST